MTEATQMSTEEIRRELLKCQHSENNYKSRLSSLNNTRKEVAHQIQEITQEYERKLKHLDSKVSRLEGENRQLKKKASVYKGEIQSFEQRLIEKEKFISKLMSKGIAEAEYVEGRSFSIRSKPRVKAVEVESEVPSHSSNLDPIKTHFENQPGWEITGTKTNEKTEAIQNAQETFQQNNLPLSEKEEVKPKKKVPPPPPTGMNKRQKRKGADIHGESEQTVKEVEPANEENMAERDQSLGESEETQKVSQQQPVFNQNSKNQTRQLIREQTTEKFQPEQASEKEERAEICEEMVEDASPQLSNEEVKISQSSQIQAPCELTEKFDLGEPVTVAQEQLPSHTGSLNEQLDQNGPDGPEENVSVQEAIEPVFVKKKMPPPPPPGKKKQGKRVGPPARNIARMPLTSDPFHEESLEAQDNQLGKRGEQESRRETQTEQLSAFPSQENKLNLNMNSEEVALANSDQHWEASEFSQTQTEDQSNILAGLSSGSYHQNIEQDRKLSENSSDFADPTSQMVGSSQRDNSEKDISKRKKRAKRLPASNQFSKQKKSFDDVQPATVENNFFTEKVDSPGNFFDSLAEGDNHANSMDSEDRKFIDESSIEQIEDTSVMSNINFGDEQNESQGVGLEGLTAQPPSKKMSKKKGKRDQIKVVDPNQFK